MEENKNRNNPGDHLANERTYLAWLRTSIGLMAFGFVVVKFSLFVKQISLVLGKPATIPNKGYSAVLGIVLVAMGAVSSVLSYLRYRQTEQQIKKGIYSHSSLLVTVVTTLVFFVSVLLIAYLIETT